MGKTTGQNTVFKEKYEPLGPKSAEIIQKTRKYIAPSYEPYPFVVDRSEGVWLYDPDGNKAIDLLSAYSAVLAHRHSDILQALIKAASQGSVSSRAIYNTRLAELGEKIANITGYEGGAIPKSDGSSVTDAAITALFRHAAMRGIKNPNVILTRDYFHGRTLIFASNAIFDEDQSYLLSHRDPRIKVVEHNPKAIEEEIDENTIGIFVEVHKGEGGPLFTSKEEYMAIRELARKHKIFFGADEIQTGLGRCGYMMAWQEFVEKGEKFGEEKARPDFVTLGKALGGGVYPVSVLIGTKGFMSIYKPGIDGSTFGGNPIACAVALASLNYIVNDGIPQKAIEMGNYFAKRLREIPGINVEHRGCLIRVEIKGVRSTKPLCLKMLLGGHEPRVFIKHGHYNQERDVAYMRVAPPIGAITKELIDLAMETIGPVLGSAAQKAA